MKEYMSIEPTKADNDYNELGNKKVRLIPLDVGIKIKCRDYVFNELKNKPFIQNNFKLRVKRLNRWWYSIYFDEKCEHECEPIIINGIEFCPECKEKIWECVSGQYK
jgi:hypothetical protein